MTKIINCYQTQTAQAGKGKRLNLKCFNIFLTALIFIFGLFYLINASDLAVKGFALKEFKTQSSILASAKLDSEEKVNNLQSYYSLNSRTQRLNMIAIGEIEYIAAPSIVVARK